MDKDEKKILDWVNRDRKGRQRMALDITLSILIIAGFLVWVVITK